MIVVRWGCGSCSYHFVLQVVHALALVVCFSLASCVCHKLVFGVASCSASASSTAWKLWSVQRSALELHIVDLLLPPVFSASKISSNEADVLPLQLIGFYNGSHSDLSREFAVAVEGGEDEEAEGVAIGRGGKAGKGKGAKKASTGKSKTGKDGEPRNARAQVKGMRLFFHVCISLTVLAINFLLC